VNVDAIAVDGIWWRQTPHGGDPLFRADPPSDGRWQRGETVCGLYFADSEQTAWAEWYRALSELALPPDRQLPRDLWRWHIDIERVADLSSGDRLAAVGLEAPRPIQRQWPAFQVIGERLERRISRSPRTQRSPPGPVRPVPVPRNRRHRRRYAAAPPDHLPPRPCTTDREDHLTASAGPP